MLMQNLPEPMILLKPAVAPIVMISRKNPIHCRSFVGGWIGAKVSMKESNPKLVSILAARRAL